MNKQIMKKLFSGIHGLVPNPPKMPIVGKESNPKLIKGVNEKANLSLLRGRLAFVLL